MQPESLPTCVTSFRKQATPRRDCLILKLRAPARGFHVVLVEPEIAANTGAIGRTCVAVGATLWLVRPLGFHLDDRNLRRAGLDYWQHLDLRVVDSLDEVVDRLGGDRLWFFSTKATQRLHPGSLPARRCPGLRPREPRPAGTALERTPGTRTPDSDFPGGSEPESGERRGHRPL